MVGGFSGFGTLTRRRIYAEVQSRQRMSELAHVNRYSMADELTASIAQELNQRLGAILTNAETLEVMLRSPLLDLNELKEIACFGTKAVNDAKERRRCERHIRCDEAQSCI
jgi:signal transduction histidine kinase